MKIHNLEDLGAAIRARRKVAGMTLDQAADLLGVSRRFLIELEHGKRRASIEKVMVVLDALGLELVLQPRGQSRSGVKIAFGTDGSTPWAVHLEMEDMVRSGMTAAEVIAAATGNAAELMHLADVGTLAAGKRADFVVLDGNPLDDITNTRRIDAVYLRGTAVDREALAARFLARTVPSS